MSVGRSVPRASPLHKLGRPEGHCTFTIPSGYPLQVAEQTSHRDALIENTIDCSDSLALEIVNQTPYRGVHITLAGLSKNMAALQQCHRRKHIDLSIVCMNLLLNVIKFLLFCQVHIFYHSVATLEIKCMSATMDYFSEWRGYGSGGGYCIVLDTRRMCCLLDMEFNKYYWSHLNFDGMFYAGDDFRMSNVFPELVDVFSEFL